ncbi:MAG: hypothetical protein QM831_15685 [Kofleriaceae bacterium]
MRALLASLLVVSACSGSGSRAEPPLRSVELVLPGHVDVRAAFPADQDPKSHIQPIATALIAARTTCSAASPAAMLELEVHRNHLQARARTVTAECLAHALDGVSIADSDVVVQLIVNAG